MQPRLTRANPKNLARETVMMPPPATQNRLVLNWCCGWAAAQVLLEEDKLDGAVWMKEKEQGEHPADG